jgi:(p)ppGpp synthase/HD superfamily hydrolase
MSNPSASPSPLDTALQIMAQAHAGQVDKAGQPYVLHPIRVMMRLATLEERVVALLHDVVEDSDLTLDDLRARGFSPAVVAAVDCLTKVEGETYDAFVSRVLTDPLAARVKIADLLENIDLTRLTEVREADLARVAKYHRALARLTAAGASQRAPSTL